MRIIQTSNFWQSGNSNHLNLYTSPLSRPTFYSPMWASISVFLVAIVSTKIEHDDALSTISILPMVEPCPKIYNHLKLEEIINICFAMIPSTQSTILGWARIFRRPDIYALSEPNPWQDPANPGPVPPDVRNSMATEAECKHHCNKIWKMSMIPLPTLVILSTQPLIKSFKINLNQCNKLEIAVLETAELVKL